MPATPPDLIAHVAAALPQAAAVCVGYSGGLDSTVLLHLLATTPALRGHGLRAVHVHHGLHPDADTWAAHCRATCEALGVALEVRHVTVPREAGLGPEAAARHARHAAFRDALADDEVLALAHHRDDQAETFLLRALRGSGPDGLAAMRTWSRLGAHRVWRPLLDLPRARLEAYAHHHALRWHHDPSNDDTRFDRNFLRQRLLPLLRERWPEADTSFARSARLCADAASLLEAEDARALADATTADPAVLSRQRLRVLPAARRARVLRRWIASHNLPPLPAEGVARIEHELLDARDDADAAFAWHGAHVRAWRDLLRAARDVPSLPTDWQQAWDGRAPLPLPDGGALALHGTAQFPQALHVTARTGGERITLPGRDHSHALKHVLQDLGVPPWEREHLPLLRDAAGAVLAAGDLAYGAAFDTWLRQHGARLRWTPPA